MAEPAGNLFDFLEPDLNRPGSRLIGAPGLDPGSHRPEAGPDHDPLLSGAGAG
jgi:hypothetical protein